MTGSILTTEASKNQGAVFKTQVGAEKKVVVEGINHLVPLSSSALEGSTLKKLLSVGLTNKIDANKYYL